ncbi:MAG: prephenate dehydrogenase/arogenate dehydrogenase family protein [Cellvibrio sp.]|nr:prephenate dehydrogenase/arogenate dehydrogenase family protein [Cellvibrio sp.]
MSDSVQEIPFIRKLVVVGIGLIGGSFAAGLKNRGACEEVIGISRNPDQAKQAVELGVVDRAFTSLDEIATELTDEDVIFIAVPTLSVEKVLLDIHRCVTAKVTITDGASVKGNVFIAAQKIFGQMPSEFVLGHPIAGSEKSGVTAANPNLYENHRVILTPVESTSAQHLLRVTQLWEILGAEVLTMTVEDHDDVLAATSHLPHAIAYSLVDTLAHDIANPNIFRYAAGGFRDFTRIASSDPVMWHDIMKANKAAILRSLDLFTDNLQRMRSSIEKEDSDYLLEVFSRAKEARDEYTKMLKQ